MLGGRFFSFTRMLFGELFAVLRKLRNIAGRAGFHLTPGHSMHRVNSILMQAPKMMIFETAANLELWPIILPHYRFVRFLERGHHRNLVIMAANLSLLQISFI